MKDMSLWNAADWTAAIAVVVLGFFLAVGASIAMSKKEEAFGHPKGLYMLFFAEMWERFSYYGMRALLIFYLTQHWLFTDGASTAIYGSYTALVYITPVLGGYLADRYLGQRKAVLFGGVLLAFGHLFMAFEGVGGQEDPTINVFWLALALIIVGSGFLKANISVMVGQLYRLTDLRRDAAYTIFYMGINVGAAIGTILVGYLGQTLGWAYGFGLAGIGMLAGLVVFVLGKKVLLGAGEAPAPLAKSKEFMIYAVGLAAVAIMWLLVQDDETVQNILLVSGFALLGYVLYIAFTKLEKEPRERVFAILFLVSLNPLFWGLFEQAGGSLNLYTDRFVDTGGVPASIFQSINPIYIILLAPVFAAVWQFLGRKGLEPSAPAKFGIALILLGIGFLVFVLGGNGDAMTPVLFVFLIYFFHTAGELCLSPVGLSAMNRLAPAFMASLIMGAWFYMSAVGNFVAGKIGEATGGEDGEMTKEATLAIYDKIGWISIGVGVAVILVSPLVKRWMHLDTLKDADPHLEGEGAAGMEAQEAGVHPTTKPTA
ncbi:peptide MFS transporter [Sphingomicrobium arenosum]|uniref:peptide MFS transporter n=1 Tax=Sphingomicrobium arenosum TaxID=2233861 RepID=UPI00223F2B9E|nr:peptide MFS transporter [Sphingomicrobium arenosum]